MKKYKNRADVEEKYKWDLTDLFKNDKDFEKSYKKAKKDVVELKKYIGCTKDSDKLLEFLIKDINTIALVERLYIYSYLINDQELGNSKSIDRKNKASDLYNLYSLNVSFFNPELLKLSTDEYNKLFKNDKLMEFKKSLDDIYRNKEHILDEKSENIISELTNAMNHFEDMSSTMLNSEHDYGDITVDGETEKITTTNYRRLMKNEDRNLRKDVREKFTKVIDRYGVSSSQFLNGYVKSNITLSKLHNYKDAWDAKLFGLKLTDKAYKALIDVVINNVDSLKRYYDVYKKRFNLDNLYQYDLGLDFTSSKREYSIEEAQELCLEVVKPLGDDYVNHFKKIFENRYIDYAQYPSKCSGGYSFAPLDRDSRILMSYNYDLESISTIIHEGGHNVHHQYVAEHNPLEYRGVSSLIAEVASLTNECLLSNYLASNAKDNNTKIAGVSNIVDVIISNLFGAVREGKMELDFYNYVNDGNTITKDYMKELDLESLKTFYGDRVILDELSGLSWIRRSHYYMNYYLFNYAFCISVATNVATKILDGNKDMLDKYLKFLKTGSDTDVLDVFKIIDIDLEDKCVYENAIKYFDSMVNKLDKLI